MLENMLCSIQDVLIYQYTKLIIILFGDKKIGFEILKGNAEIDDTRVTLDYNKPNDPKVLFEIRI